MVTDIARLSFATRRLHHASGSALSPSLTAYAIMIATASGVNCFRASRPNRELRCLRLLHHQTTCRCRIRPARANQPEATRLLDDAATGSWTTRLPAPQVMSRFSFNRRRARAEDSTEQEAALLRRWEVRMHEHATTVPRTYPLPKYLRPSAYLIRTEYLTRLQHPWEKSLSMTARGISMAHTIVVRVAEGRSAAWRQRSWWMSKAAVAALRCAEAVRFVRIHLPCCLYLAFGRQIIIMCESAGLSCAPTSFAVRLKRVLRRHDHDVSNNRKSTCGQS